MIDTSGPRVRHPTRLAATLLAFTLVLLGWSAYHPKETFTWFLEVSPAIVAIIVLLATYRRFPLTRLSYTLIAIHACILIIGGHYTYAEVPAGLWLKEALDLSRNHYDRLGHFAQGFVPAAIAREVLLRTSPLTRGKWLAFLVFCVCVAISGLYELVEWAVAEFDSAGSTAFLGTQGDVWDTQKDIAFCAIGASIAVATVPIVQDRELGLPGRIRHPDR